MNNKDTEWVKDNIIVDAMFIGIDPGVNGGVAILDYIDGIEHCCSFRCPKTVGEMAMGLGSKIKSKPSHDIFVYIEHVHSMPKQGVVSTFTFGQNFGQWQGILASYELDFNLISPMKWMNTLGLPKLQRKERKRWLKDKAEQLFPNEKMTFNVSDSFLIANYGKELYYKEKADVTDMV